jgi:hypothetical protein
MEIILSYLLMLLVILEKSLLYSCSLELCVCVITEWWFMLQIAVHSGNEVVTQKCGDRKYRIYVLDIFCTEIQAGAAF